MARFSDSLITALGFTRAQERLYVRLLSQNGRGLDDVAAALLRETDELVEAMQPFVDQGIVRVEPEAGDRPGRGKVFVLSPGEAVARVLEQTADLSARAESRLREVASALPFLSASAARPQPGEVHDVEPLDGEVSSGGNVPGLLAALVLQSRGDILQLRPDQWREGLDPAYDPVTDPKLDLLRAALEQGRRWRTVYPVRAAHEVPELLRHRTEIGEEVRLVPVVSTRMLVLGRTHAILPEPLGITEEPRSLIRQRGLVEALTAWFDEHWARGAPLPETGAMASAGRTDLRRFLLTELASGSQDEQIARRLGISLRTVRRRVAELMAELGADSRFQAGVEATRRGWL